jgi:xylulokinase
VAIASRPTASARGASGRVELDLLWAIARDACAEAVVAAATGRAITVRGLAVSSAGCLSVWLDADGRPIDTAVTDAAVLDALWRLADAVGLSAYRAITGYPLDVHTAACRMAAVPARDRERARAILSVGDYIAFRLTGRVAHEFSTALSYGLWDYRHDGWWADGLALVGLDAAALGTPVESGSPIGPLTREAAIALGLPPSTMVFTGGHDYPAAALAADLQPGRELLNVTGTYEILASLHQDALRVRGDDGVRGIKDHHVVPGHYSHLLEAYGAGVVEWLRGTVLARPGEAPPDLGTWFAALEGPPPASSAAPELYIPPPVRSLPTDGNWRAMGTFAGLAVDADGATRLRSMIVGLCFQARQMLDRQREVIGAGDVAIKSVGGGSRSEVWRQTKADVLGTAIRVPRVTEASALGAALLAGVGAGVYRGYTEAGAVAAALGEEVVEPDPARSARYAETYETAYLPLAAEVEARVPRLEAIVARRTGQA